MVVNFYHLADISNPQQVMLVTVLRIAMHTHLNRSLWHHAFNLNIRVRNDHDFNASHSIPPIRRCTEWQVYRQHKAALSGLDVRGRIYISPQGINAQYSGPEADAVQYAQWVERQPEFQVSRDACG